MDRQTLRDWVHRFNASGPGGLFDNWTDGPKSRLSQEQRAEFARIVESGPDREIDGVVRWRRTDLKRVIAERFSVDFHPRYIGKYGFKTRPGLVRRTASSVTGPSEEPGQGNLPISATTTHTCLARSALPAASEQHWRWPYADTDMMQLHLDNSQCR